MDGKCFNLWEKEGSKYFNVATLFFQDPLCGTQWTVDGKTKALSYSAGEIQDELESPLKQIPAEKAQKLLKLTSPQEAADSIDGLLE
jgi:hypothetical protein